MGGGSRSAGAAPADDDGGGPAALGELLGAAVRAGSAVTPEGERRAVAAFRAARDAREHAAGAGRRDDRRPRATRRVGWPVRAAVGALLTSVTLGGVAVASMGGLHGSAPERPRPSPTAPGRATPPSLRPSSPTDPVAPLIKPPHTSPEPPQTKKHDGQGRGGQDHDGTWHDGKGHPKGKGHQGKGHDNGKSRLGKQSEGERPGGKGPDGKRDEDRKRDGDRTYDGKKRDGERRHGHGKGRPQKAHHGDGARHGSTTRHHEQRHEKPARPAGPETAQQAREAREK
ncbi:hypothetical protein ABZ840_16490 [Streptomyces sp. NPDC047117]|uniref:hypothetical protein n=1 Tax=Streptomyces sp. NPDC047117 TaxID=3155379 RepID=UPI0033F08668